MRVAQSSDELLFQLHEIRPKDAVKSFRRSIIEGYPGDVCAYCGRPATSWTLDHIIPKSKGGPTRRWNLARCCSHCNGNKGSHDLLPWYRPQLFWEEDRENTLFQWILTFLTFTKILLENHHFTFVTRLRRNLRAPFKKFSVCSRFNIFFCPFHLHLFINREVRVKRWQQTCFRL